MLPKRVCPTTILRTTFIRANIVLNLLPIDMKANRERGARGNRCPAPFPLYISTHLHLQYDYNSNGFLKISCTDNGNEVWYHFDIHRKIAFFEIKDEDKENNNGKTYQPNGRHSYSYRTRSFSWNFPSPNSKVGVVCPHQLLEFHFKVLNWRWFVGVDLIFHVAPIVITSSRENTVRKLFPSKMDGIASCVTRSAIFLKISVAQIQSIQFRP